MNDNVVELRAAERKKRALTAVFDILEDLHFLSCLNGAAHPKKSDAGISLEHRRAAMMNRFKL